MKNINKYQRFKEAGQTLFEALLAFSVSILVLTSIIVGVTTSLSNSQYTKNQNLANSYAQEGMAVVRKIRDSSWYDFSAGLKDYKQNTKYCINKNLELIEISNLTQNCTGNDAVGTGGIFSREVKFEDDSPACSAGGTPAPTPAQTPAVNGTKVTVKTSWTDNKCPVGSPYCHKTELISCFSNLDEKSLVSFTLLPTFAPSPTPTPTSTPTPTPTPGSLPGWTQCAQFTNTNADDVASNFMDGCLNTTGLRVRVYNGATLEDDLYTTGMNPVTAWPNLNYLGGMPGNTKLTNWPAANFFFTATNGKDACGSPASPSGLTFGSGWASKAIIAPDNTNDYEYRLNCGDVPLTGREIIIYKQ